MGEHRVKTLRMLGCRTETGAVHSADYERCDRLAAKHVTEFGGLVEDLVEANAHEVHEHQFDDRTQARRGGSDGGANEGRFADRRIQNTIAELAP